MAIIVLPDIGHRSIPRNEPDFRLAGLCCLHIYILFSLTSSTIQMMLEHPPRTAPGSRSGGIVICLTANVAVFSESMTMQDGKVQNFKRA